MAYFGTVSDVPRVATLMADAGASTSTQGRVRYLDGWRGLSIALVLIGHFCPVPGIDLGRMGVEFFFVLSGRLMAEILFVERVPLRIFFTRRLSRIYPALLVFVLLMLVVTRRTPLQVGPVAAATALSFTLNYASVFAHHTGAFDHIWSLCIEEHTYVLLAGLAFLLRRSGTAIIILAVAAGLSMLDAGLSRHLGQDYYAVYWRTDAHVSSILIAAALYLALLARLSSWRQAWPALSWTPVVAVAVAVALNLEAVPDAIKYSAGTALLALAVCTLDLAPPNLLKVLSWPGVTLVGLWSYSLYLWQQPFYKLIGAEPVPLLLGLAVLCAIASHYGVEKPIRRVLNRRLAPLPKPHTFGETAAMSRLLMADAPQGR